MAVTLAAMMATSASPTDLPIWLTVLKTPPARACVLPGKTDVMSRLETVKRLSAPVGLKTLACHGLAVCHTHLERMQTEVALTRNPVAQ